MIDEDSASQLALMIRSSGAKKHDDIIHVIRQFFMKGIPSSAHGTINANTGLLSIDDDAHNAAYDDLD
jgi:hypothetical protein